MSMAGEMGEEYRVIRELKFDVQKASNLGPRTVARLARLSCWTFCSCERSRGQRALGEST
jgi:hypothetical protein